MRGQEIRRWVETRKVEHALESNSLGGFAKDVLLVADALEM